MDEQGRKMDISKIKVILATDCGSTTSKARLFHKIKGEFRFVASGEAPTTVEAPFENVTLGVSNAIREIEEQLGLRILGKNGIITPFKGGKEGVDLYVTTSSAGGGLQMMVAGVVKSMTAESAERAALGAGAIVMDVMAINDGRMPYERIEKMRKLRPDMILLAGGTDGGTISHVTDIAEQIKSANPKPRLGSNYKLPIIYAGNKDVQNYMTKLFNNFELKVVPNLRPLLEFENVGPARATIHEFFMEHVMSHAPGYDQLMKWTEIPIMPTPAGEGIMFQTLAKEYDANVIGVGLGGATTNVYSSYEGRFVRTVSANLGMSYSITNVVKETGMKNIMRWLPFEADTWEIYDRLLNKTIRPTTIPQTLEDLIVEHAVAREALRLGFEHHKFLARPLQGARRKIHMSDMLDQKTYEESYIDMLKIEWLTGTGGLLSHAPRRSQSALMLIDAFQPIGITKIGQDSVFMIPHLGILSTVHPSAAMEIFEKDCLVHIGTCIAPRGDYEENCEDIMSFKFEMPNGEIIEGSSKSGEIKKITLKEFETVKAELQPGSRFDLGAGEGKEVITTVEGGVVGIIIDTRGRPLTLSEDTKMRTDKLLEWFKSLNAYPTQIIGHRM